MCKKLSLVVFDMDGVLVECSSSWEYLHRRIGSLGYVRSRGYLEQFRRRLITYEEWVKLDLEAMIKFRNGCLSRDEIVSILNEVKIKNEARLVVNYLRNLGVKLAIVSGGLEILARRVAHELGIDIVYANRLIFDSNGCLVPKVPKGVDTVNPINKGVIIKELCSKLQIPLSKVMYIGDSEWDLSAFKVVKYPVLVRDDLRRSIMLHNLIIVSNLRYVIDIIKRICYEGKLPSYLTHGK